MHDRLVLADQVSFRALRVSRQRTLVQCIWIYDRPVDLDTLRAFTRNLSRGMLGRRIEPSPFWFARSRWVALDASPEIEVAETAWPKNCLGEWAGEFACLPIDPEFGPGWRIGAAPLVEGGCAVSLVVSHSVADALGVSRAIVGAAQGATPDLGYQQPSARRWWTALAQDAWFFLKHELPAVIRSVLAVAKAARDEDSGPKSSSGPQAPREVETKREQRVLSNPTTYVTVDLAAWDARAASLGGTSNSLLCGLLAKLAQRLRWTSPSDGTVRLVMPVSERSESDFRANALSAIDIIVDPATATESLGEIRKKTKLALAKRKDEPPSYERVLPLLLVLPDIAVRKMLEALPDQDSRPTTNSYLGQLHPLIMNPDGTTANSFFMRLATPGVPGVDRAFDQDELYALSGRVGGKLFITVNTNLLKEENSQTEIKKAILSSLAQFGVDGTIL